jgi:hypothetical protein
MSKKRRTMLDEVYGLVNAKYEEAVSIANAKIEDVTTRAYFEGRRATLAGVLDIIERVQANARTSK